MGYSSLIIPCRCPCPEMQTWDSRRVNVLAYSSSAVPGPGQWQALGEAFALAVEVGVSVSLGREGGSRHWREKGPQQHQLQRDSQPQPWGRGGCPKPDPWARLGLGLLGDTSGLATAGARRGHLPPHPSQSQPAPKQAGGLVCLGPGPGPPRQ